MPIRVLRSITTVTVIIRPIGYIKTRCKYAICRLLEHFYSLRLSSRVARLWIIWFTSTSSQFGLFNVLNMLNMRNICVCAECVRRRSFAMAIGNVTVPVCIWLRKLIVDVQNWLIRWKCNMSKCFACNITRNVKRQTHLHDIIRVIIEQTLPRL